MLLLFIFSNFYIIFVTKQDYIEQILDRNIWYHITACKKLLRNNAKNFNINIQYIQFSNLYA